MDQNPGPEEPAPDLNAVPEEEEPEDEEKAAVNAVTLVVAGEGAETRHPVADSMWNRDQDLVAKQDAQRKSRASHASLHLDGHEDAMDEHSRLFALRARIFPMQARAGDALTEEETKEALDRLRVEKQVQREFLQTFVAQMTRIDSRLLVSSPGLHDLVITDKLLVFLR